MVDAEIGLGFSATPRTIAGTMGGLEFGGWGVSEHWGNDLLRTSMGLDPSPDELSPMAVAGMLALGGFFGGVLKSKTLESLLERASNKKAVKQLLTDTTGNRYFQDITTPERQAELMKIATGGKTAKQGIMPVTDESLNAIATGGKKAKEGIEPVTDKMLHSLGKDIEQRVLESVGVPKKLATPEAVEKLGGVEQVLKNTLADEPAVKRALNQIDDATRLVTQAREYDVSAQAFTAERTGGKVMDTFIPDESGVARKVRVVERKNLPMIRPKSEMAASVPDHIKKSVSIGSAAIVSGLIYTNLGNNQWDIQETQWVTPSMAQRIAELARDDYRINRNRQASINKAMNVLPDNYALNPDNYKMVYDRFMRLTGGLS
jgi:hypothetical protein